MNVGIIKIARRHLTKSVLFLNPVKQIINPFIDKQYMGRTLSEGGRGSPVLANSFNAVGPIILKTKHITMSLLLIRCLATV